MKRAMRIVLKPISVTNLVFYLSCKDSYLYDDRNMITKDDMEMCQGLFGRKCETPRDTLLDSDAWSHIYNRIAQRNKTAFIRLMARYIVSSAELKTCRGKFSKSISLVGSINEAWTYSVRLQGDPRSAYITLHIACKSSTPKYEKKRNTTQNPRLSLLASHLFSRKG